MRRVPPRHLLDNLEIYLTVAGLVVAFVIPTLVTGHAPWRLVAILALGVSVVHGFLFWLVRRRQRRIRAELLAEIRGMLRDRVNNDLTVVVAALGHVRESGALAGATSDHAHADLRDALDASRRISALLDELSLEGLRRWQARYGDALRDLPRALRHPAGD